MSIPCLTEKQHQPLVAPGWWVGFSPAPPIQQTGLASWTGGYLIRLFRDVLHPCRFCRLALPRRLPLLHSFQVFPTLMTSRNSVSSSKPRFRRCSPLACYKMFRTLENKTRFEKVVLSDEDMEYIGLVVQFRSFSPVFPLLSVSLLPSLFPGSVVLRGSRRSVNSSFHRAFGP